MHIVKFQMNRYYIFNCLCFKKKLKFNKDRKLKSCCPKYGDIEQEQEKICHELQHNEDEKIKGNFTKYILGNSPEIQNLDLKEHLSSSTNNINTFRMRQGNQFLTLSLGGLHHSQRELDRNQLPARSSEQRNRSVHLRSDPILLGCLLRASLLRVRNRLLLFQPLHQLVAHVALHQIFPKIHSEECVYNGYLELPLFGNRLHRNFVQYCLGNFERHLKGKFD